MESGYYNESGDPGPPEDELAWPAFAVLWAILHLFMAVEVLVRIPRRVFRFLKETFARY